MPQTHHGRMFKTAERMQSFMSASSCPSSLPLLDTTMTNRTFMRFQPPRQSTLTELAADFNIYTEIVDFQWYITD